MLGLKYSNTQKQQHKMYFSLFLIVSLVLFFLFVRDGYMHNEDLRFITTAMILCVLAIYLLSFAKKNLVVSEKTLKDYKTAIKLVKGVSLFIQLNLLIVVSFIVISNICNYLHVFSETIQIAFLLPLNNLHILGNGFQWKYLLNVAFVVLMLHGTFKLIQYIVIWTSFSSKGISDDSNENVPEYSEEENPYIFSTSLGYFYLFSSAN